MNDLNTSISSIGSTLPSSNESSIPSTEIILDPVELAEKEVSTANIQLEEAQGFLAAVTAREVGFTGDQKLLDGANSFINKNIANGATLEEIEQKAAARLNESFIAGDDRNNPDKINNYRQLLATVRLVKQGAPVQMITSRALSQVDHAINADKVDIKKVSEGAIDQVKERYVAKIEAERKRKEELKKEADIAVQEAKRKGEFVPIKSSQKPIPENHIRLFRGVKPKAASVEFVGPPTPEELDEFDRMNHAFMKGQLSEEDKQKHIERSFKFLNRSHRWYCDDYNVASGKYSGEGPIYSLDVTQDEAWKYMKNNGMAESAFMLPFEDFKDRMKLFAVGKNTPEDINLRPL
jgi:hypothetical protein